MSETGLNDLLDHIRDGHTNTERQRREVEDWRATHDMLGQPDKEQVTRLHLCLHEQDVHRRGSV
jgi:hypothetical protein